MREVLETIISQYATSARIVQVIESYNAAVSPTENIQSFYDLMWNIDTAVGHGLDVWGRIVGINRVLTIQNDVWFGFAEQPESEGFDQAAFWNGQLLTDNFVLTDESFRQVILAKAAANICDGSIPAINRILMALFPGRGNAFVTDGGNAAPGAPFFGFAEQPDSEGFDQAPFWGVGGGPQPSTMSMVYTFQFHLEDFEKAIVNSGVLPKSTGVHATVSYL